MRKMLRSRKKKSEQNRLQRVPTCQENEVEKLPSRVECLTFVVHGIGQYHRAQQGVNSQFFKAPFCVFDAICYMLVIG